MESTQNNKYTLGKKLRLGSSRTLRVPPIPINILGWDTGNLVCVTVDEEKKEIILSQTEPTHFYCLGCRTEKPITDISSNSLRLCKECYSKINNKHRQDYRRRNPVRAKAHNKFYYAVSNGNLVKEPCCVCGTTKNIEGHHPNYRKPERVIWLCRKHHLEVHKRMKRNKMKRKQ